MILENKCCFHVKAAAALDKVVSSGGVVHLCIRKIVTAARETTSLWRLTRRVLVTSRHSTIIWAGTVCSQSYVTTCDEDVVMLVWSICIPLWSVIFMANPVRIRSYTFIAILEPSILQSTYPPVEPRFTDNGFVYNFVQNSVLVARLVKRSPNELLCGTYCFILFYLFICVISYCNY